MQIRDIPAIKMLGAEAHNVICGQNDTTPTLCDTPEDSGGMANSISCLGAADSKASFNPHPLGIAKQHANLVCVQQVSRFGRAESARLRGLV